MPGIIIMLHVQLHSTEPSCMPTMTAQYQRSWAFIGSQSKDNCGFDHAVLPILHIATLVREQNLSDSPIPRHASYPSANTVNTGTAIKSINIS